MMITAHIWTIWAGLHMVSAKSSICAIYVGTTWGRTTAGTTGGGPAAGTGSVEAGATTGERSSSGAGAEDLWYIDKPVFVSVSRSMFMLDGSHKQIVSS